MDWLRRKGRPPSPAAPPPDEAVPLPPVARASPGIAALLEGVRERRHCVLDLGPAAGSSLRVYDGFARWVRFADLLDAATHGGWADALGELRPHPDRPYDLLFAWDILDRIFPEERPRLIARLAELSSADARLYLAVDASGRAAAPPLRFELVDAESVRYEPTGPPRPTLPPLLPAEVERLVTPFRVTRAFTLKGGMREYLAVRDGS